MGGSILKDKNVGSNGAPPPEEKLYREQHDSMQCLAAIVIPAHKTSRRLPNKPLLDRTGLPLVCHTVANAIKAERAADVGIITDFPAIRKAVHSKFKCKCLPVISYREAICGSQRVGYWIDEFEAWDTYNVVVNLQCDEPCIDPKDLDNLIAACHVSEEICTLVKQLDKGDERDPNVVKAWLRGSAIKDFSRALLPKYAGVPVRQHLGVYAVPRKRFAACFREHTCQRAQSMSLEQITWLDAGCKIVAVEVKHSVEPVSVNTPADYDRFCRWHTARELPKVGP